MTGRFDSQAANYDRRVGLPDDVAQRVAVSIAGLAGNREAGLLLEIGVGTGQIGYYLQELPLRYLGFDISAAMLRQFGERFGQGQAAPQVMEADGNESWPVEDASVDVVFSSRALHLLDRNHVVSEFFRVASPAGAFLLTGRVQRETDSVKVEMRRRMRRLLKERGIEGRSGESSRAAVFAACCARGAVRIDPLIVARWPADWSPARSIESWQNKPGLAGADVSDSLKQEVLDELREWASSRYENLQLPMRMEESYVLDGVTIPGIRR